MLNIIAIAQALVDKQATVASVAKTIGTLGEQRSSEYKIQTGEPGVLASIGMPSGHDATAAPDSVRIFFLGEHPIQLATILPSCKHWKQIPNNPSATPYLYACPFDGSSHSVQVVFIAALSDDIANPMAPLTSLLLQRNVMQ
jgi:hypothetical protein